MISMVLQSRSSTPADVSGALLHLEPICAGMCAAREDRMIEVVPYLEAEIELQTDQFDDLSRYVPNARRFHEAIVSRCGNEPMILLIGSLELIWSAHESSVWSDEGDPMSRKTMRAALRDVPSRCTITERIELISIPFLQTQRLTHTVAVWLPNTRIVAQPRAGRPSPECPCEPITIRSDPSGSAIRATTGYWIAIERFCPPARLGNVSFNTPFSSFAVVPASSMSLPSVKLRATLPL